MQREDQIHGRSNERDVSPLPQDAVTEDIRARVMRMIRPGGYRITGYVLTQTISSWKAIADVSGTRWMSPADMTRIMQWEQPIGTGEPPAGQTYDHAACQSATALAVPAPSAPTVLTTAPSQSIPDDVEQAFGELAKELGCHYNSMIPHNTGWFVPGKATAHASAYDAIKALVSQLGIGGTVYRKPQQGRPLGITESRLTGRDDVARDTQTAAGPVQSALF